MILLGAQVMEFGAFDSFRIFKDGVCFVEYSKCNLESCGFNTGFLS